MEAVTQPDEPSPTETEAASKKPREELRHLTLRLPTEPHSSHQLDESAALTRVRALTEIITGKRYTIHALITDVVDRAAESARELPIPKARLIPKGSSYERIDVRLTKRQLDILDGIRDAMKPHSDVMDLREYYGRVDVIRQLLLWEIERVEGEFGRMIVKFFKTQR